MKKLEKASVLTTPTTNKELGISPINEILTKRTEPEQRTKALSPTNNQKVKSKKLKIEVISSKKLNLVDEYQRTRMDHEDLSLNLSQENFKHSFTKENIEHFLCFNLGKWTLIIP